MLFSFFPFSSFLLLSRAGCSRVWSLQLFWTWDLTLAKLSLARWLVCFLFVLLSLVWQVAALLQVGDSISRPAWYVTNLTAARKHS